MAAPIDIPVVVIGGGGCGLTSSILLSDLNVEHVLFEKHPSTSILPKAHYLNQRTMETYRHFGISDEITRISCPPQHMCRIEFKSSLGGDGPHDGRLYGYNSAWGNDISHPDYDIWRFVINY
jgi:2,4-dichlorophenol 6-monooxygenase